MTAGAETFASSPVRRPPSRLTPNTPQRSPLSSWYVDASDQLRPVMSPLSPLQYRSSAVYTRRDDLTPRRASPLFTTRGVRASGNSLHINTSNNNNNNNTNGVSSPVPMSPRVALLAQRRYHVMPSDFSTPTEVQPTRRALSSNLYRGSAAGSPGRHVGGPHSPQSPYLDIVSTPRPLSARQPSLLAQQSPPQLHLQLQHQHQPQQQYRHQPQQPSHHQYQYQYQQKQVQQQQQQQQQQVQNQQQQEHQQQQQQVQDHQKQQQQQEEEVQNQQRQQKQQQQHQHQHHGTSGQKFKGNRRDDDSLVTSSNDLSNPEDGFLSQAKLNNQEYIGEGPSIVNINHTREVTTTHPGDSPNRTKITVEPISQIFVQRVATPAGRRVRTPDYYSPLRKSPSMDSSILGNSQRIDLNSTRNSDINIHDNLCVAPQRKPVTVNASANTYSSVRSSIVQRCLNGDIPIKVISQPITAPGTTTTAGTTPTQSTECSRSSTDTSNVTNNIIFKTPLYLDSNISLVSCRSIMRQFVQRWRNNYEENKNAYHEGGYMAVTPGKKLNSRYVVVQKLGWGEFSTVWLAYDTMHTTLGKPHQAFVALKIAKCDNTVSESTQYEINLLRYIGLQSSTNAPLTKLVDCFEVSGHYGSHVCMVMPLHGSNLLSIIDQMKAKKCIRSNSEIRLIKEIVASILIGLVELDAMDVIHTDIKPENILCSSPDPKVLNVIENFCRRNQERSTMIPHEEIREAMEKGDPNHLVCLADFGLSVALKPPTQLDSSQTEINSPLLTRLIGTKKEFPVKTAGTVLNYRGTMIQTREYRAPEIIMGLDFNTRSDLWSVGCLVYELITGDFLMDPKRRTKNERMMDVEHLAMMMQLLGPVPEYIIQLRTQRDANRPPPRYIHRYFDENGKFMYADKYRLYPRRHLDRELELFLPLTEAKAAAGFIMNCLAAYDPHRRPAAQEMLSHAWLADLGSQRSY